MHRLTNDPPRSASRALLVLLAATVPVPAAAQQPDLPSGDGSAVGPDDAAVAGGTGSGAAEEEPPVAFTAEFDFVSRYVWRGLALTAGPAMQPLFDLDTLGFSLWTWWNMPLANEAHQGHIDEVDAGLAYEHDGAHLAVSGEVQVWTYPGQEDSPPTGQADVKLAVPLKPFALYTLQTVDIGSFAGAWYAELGATFEWEVEDGPTVEAAAHAAFGSDRYDAAYLGVDAWACDLVQAEFSVTWPFAFFYVRAHAQASVVVDSALRAAVDEPYLAAAGIAVGTAGPP